MILFLAGFFTATVLCVTLAFLYFVHACRRVRQIQSAITRYQQASSVVGEALDKHYQPKP